MPSTDKSRQHYGLACKIRKLLVAFERRRFANYSHEASSKMGINCPKINSASIIGLLCKRGGQITSIGDSACNNSPTCRESP